MKKLLNSYNNTNCPSDKFLFLWAPTRRKNYLNIWWKLLSFQIVWKHLWSLLSRDNLKVLTTNKRALETFFIGFDKIRRNFQEQIVKFFTTSSILLMIGTIAQLETLVWTIWKLKLYIYFSNILYLCNVIWENVYDNWKSKFCLWSWII